MSKPFNFSDIQLVYLRQSVQLKIEQIRRARNQQITGSKLYDAYNEQLNDLAQLISILGG